MYAANIITIHHESIERLLKPHTIPPCYSQTIELHTVGNYGKIEMHILSWLFQYLVDKQLAKKLIKFSLALLNKLSSIVG